jgi:hypothetical protein
MEEARSRKLFLLQAVNARRFFFYESVRHQLIQCISWVRIKTFPSCSFFHGMGPKILEILKFRPLKFSFINTNVYLKK